MKTNEVIRAINENGGLDMGFIGWVSRQEGCTVRNYVYHYVYNNYPCSRYVAKNVARYYAW